MEGDSDLVRQNTEGEPSAGMRLSGIAPQGSHDKSGNT